MSRAKATRHLAIMCRVLDVSESGYYAWRKRPESPSKREDARLTASIQQVFVEYRGVYGSPRIHAELQDQGWRCSRKRIARLIQENGMDARRKRFRPITTKRNPSHPVAPNLLQQDFTASHPNEKWTGDITYIPTSEGWLYVTVLLDVFSRRVIGWAMSAHCDEVLSRPPYVWPWLDESRKASCSTTLIAEVSTPAGPTARGSDRSRSP